MVSSEASERNDTTASEQPNIGSASAQSSRSPIVQVRCAIRDRAAGVAACAAAAAVSVLLNRFVPTVSPLLLAIVIGAIVANLLPLPDRLGPGMTFSAKRLLRIGVALLGLQLVVGDVIRLGWGAVALVVGVVALGIGTTMALGRMLKLSWTQRILIACGFSICGAAAVAAADGVVEADEGEVVTAVALVVVFGTIMIPVVPALSSLLHLDAVQAGLWAGGSIHEVAQVVAAGGAIGGSALAAAVVVKLARVVMLAPVIAVLSVQRRRQARNADGSICRKPALIPLFVVAFIACVVLRSLNLVPAQVLSTAKVIQTALLAAAMFALGTGVRLSLFRKVGLRPFALAALSTVCVASIALIGVALMGREVT